MVLRPKVELKVNSAIGLIAQGGPATVAVIGTAQWGPINEVQLLGNFNEGVNIFKDDLSGTTLSLVKGLDLLYANGAGAVKAVRVDAGTAAASTLALSNGTSSAITVSGLYKGTYGDNVMVTVTANAITAGNRDLVITDGQATESYDNGTAGYSSNVAIIADVNANSNLVTMAAAGGVGNLIVALTQTNLSGGANGASSVTQANITDILNGVLYNEDFDILTVPGTTTDATQTAIVGTLNTRAANDDLYSVYFSGVAVDETLATIKARTSSGKRLALVAPAVKYINRISGVEQVLGGDYLACAYAGNTALTWPAISSTHKTLTVTGVSVLQSSGKEFYNNTEQEALLDEGVVPITKISGQIQPARAVTRHGTTTDVWYEQNIVDIVDYVQRQVLDALNPFIGRPNIERNRTVMAKNVDGVLETDKNDEIINAYLPTEVTEGSSPDTVMVSMTLKPTFLVNFINVTLTLDNTQ